MISEKELAAMDLDTVNKQIEMRHELLNQMVGSLYPSIVEEEIQQLLVRRNDLLEPVKYIHLKSPFVNPNEALGQLATGVSITPIRVYSELDIFPKIKQVLKEKYGDWSWGNSSCCPGKPRHLTYRLQKGNEVKYVHFLESDHDIYYEDAP